MSTLSPSLILGTDLPVQTCKRIHLYEDVSSTFSETKQLLETLKSQTQAMSLFLSVSSMVPNT
jgi:hypothetical protein